jgi:hypothetical protein
MRLSRARSQSVDAPSVRVAVWSRRAVANLAQALTSLLITAGIFEAGSRIYLSYFRTDYPNAGTFIASRPAPYRDAPYFGTEFLDEMRRAAYLNLNGHVVQTLQMRDVSGKFINIVGASV